LLIAACLAWLARAYASGFSAQKPSLYTSRKSKALFAHMPLGSQKLLSRVQHVFTSEKLHTSKPKATKKHKAVAPALQAKQAQDVNISYDQKIRLLQAYEPNTKHENANLYTNPKVVEAKTTTQTKPKGRQNTLPLISTRSQPIVKETIITSNTSTSTSSSPKRLVW
jgi:hypothetical protein